MGRRQYRIAGSRHQPFMNRLVQLEVLRQIAPDKTRLHLKMNRLEIANLCIRDSLAGEPASQCLKPCDHLEQVPDILQRQANNARASIWKNLYQALV